MQPMISAGRLCTRVFVAKTRKMSNRWRQNQGLFETYFPLDEADAVGRVVGASARGEGPCLYAAMIGTLVR